MRFFLENTRWLAFGALLTMTSAFGQTFFFGLFANSVREAFDLSHTGFGTLYMAGTLCSAATLLWAGKLADGQNFRFAAGLLICGLGVMTLVAATATHWIIFGLAVYGLRFLGQGMMYHLSMTAMSRWFAKNRGRALSVAALGLPVAEVILPIVIAFAILQYGWRTSWLACALFVFLFCLPVALLLLSKERMRGSSVSETREGDARIRQWTRSEALRDPVFYLLSLCTMVPNFIVTGLLFHQSQLSREMGWHELLFPAGISAYSVANVCGAFLVGWLSDRFGSEKMLVPWLIPMIFGLLLISSGWGAWSVPAAMLFFGMTQAFAGIITSAVYADLYGTRHLGSIRAVLIAGSAFATALSPGLMGIWIDAGIPVGTQLFGMAAATTVFVVLLVWLQLVIGRRFRNRIA